MDVKVEQSIAYPGKVCITILPETRAEAFTLGKAAGQLELMKVEVGTYSKLYSSDDEEVCGAVTIPIGDFPDFLKPQRKKPISKQRKRRKAPPTKPEPPEDPLVSTGFFYVRKSALDARMREEELAKASETLDDIDQELDEL